MQKIKDIIKLLDDVIKDEPENNLMGGGIIKDNYDSKVDEYRGLINNSKDWLSSYQNKLAEENNITGLKIKFTSASGYFIEITKNGVKNIPDYFVHKQTLVNAIRFITPELKEFENKLLSAEGILAEREYELYLELRGDLLSKYSSIKEFSKKSTLIDFCSGLGCVAYKNNYTKPQISSSYSLNVRGGRHAVVEKIERDFISNDVCLDSKKYVHIITGPNMGGKSTFLRQNALIILMSHVGSFVPAISATIPITDKIFSRVGATDNLFLGQSTFMVEMQEMANILNNSTKNSFVIIDEIGRGTSTYDGMSLAWAILKYNHNNIKAKTLFATHYHELIDDSKTPSGCKNFSVAVGENEENLVFLRKIIEGGIKKSFGLEVASLAGINNDIIIEAKKKLKKLEFEHDKPGANQLSFGSINIEPEVKIIKEKSKIEEELEKIDLNSLTPLNALNILSTLKNKLVK